MLWLLACAVEGGGVVEEVSAPAVLRTSLLTYRVRTDWRGAAETDAGRRFTTDLGYQVELTEAWVSTTSLELVPCQVDTGWAGLPTLLPVAHAHSGHTHDVSQLSPALLEDLVPGGEREAGIAPGSGEDYCDLYQVMGPSEAGVVSWLVGTVTAPGGESWPISALSTVSTAARPPLGEGAWTDDAGVGDAVVTVSRFPARALDGLELDTISDLDLAYAFAWKLGQDQTVSWVMER